MLVLRIPELSYPIDFEPLVCLKRLLVCSTRSRQNPSTLGLHDERLKENTGPLTTGCKVICQDPGELAGIK